MAERTPDGIDTAGLCEQIADNFRTFGGGRVSDPDNPICHATKNARLQFAAGVDVREVVDFIIVAYRQKAEGCGSASQARIAVLEGALRPFAHIAKHVGPGVPDGASIPVFVRDLRAATEALSPASPSDAVAVRRETLRRAEEGVRLIWGPTHSVARELRALLEGK